MGNKYYKVHTDHAVEAHGGSEATNASYGSSRIYRQKRDMVTAKKGDEIHDLVGGRFLVSNGKATHELHDSPKSDPFERSNGKISVSKEHTKEIPHSGKKVDYNTARNKFEKTEYTPIEVVQELVKSLKSKLKAKADKDKAKRLLADLEDSDYVAEVGNTPDTEINVMDKGALKINPDAATDKSIKRNADKKIKNPDKPDYKGLNDKAPVTRSNYNKIAYKPNLPKSEDLDKCNDIKKARIDKGKGVIEKVNIRKERARDLGAADKKRHEKTSERLQNTRDQARMEKSNYGPKGADLYNPADNAKRKAKNVGDIEAGYAKIKIKAGSNASGGQGKTKLNEDMRKLAAKNKKQPVTSMKDMSPEKQAEMKKLYNKTEKSEVKKTEKLKKLLEKIRQKHK